MKKLLKCGFVLLLLFLTISNANAKCMVQLWGRWVVVTGGSCTDFFEITNNPRPCIDIDGLAHHTPKIIQTSSTEAVFENNGTKYQLASDEMQTAVNNLITVYKTNKKKYSEAEFSKILKPIADKKGIISTAGLKQIAKELKIKKITFLPNT